MFGNLFWIMFIFRLLASKQAFCKRNPKEFYLQDPSVAPPKNVKNLSRAPVGPSGQVVGSILDTAIARIDVQLRKTSRMGVGRSPGYSRFPLLRRIVSFGFKFRTVRFEIAQ